MNPIAIVDNLTLQTITTKCTIEAAGKKYVTSKGSYEIPLPLGRYVVKASCKGYEPLYLLLMSPSYLTFRVQPLLARKMA